MSRFHRTAGRRWRALRLRVLERDGWRCTECGRAGRLEVHHTTPVHRGGDPWDPAGLRALCRACHLAHHARPLTPARARWRAMVEALR